jgi:uncharacterized membrane protein
MAILLLGLIVFFGGHSARIVAEPWRTRQIERLGAGRWKAWYSLVAGIGIVLMVWGYGIARTDPVILWQPPLWTRHLAALLTLPLFVLIAAAYIPGTHIRARLGHPMLIGIKLWAAAHLIANGTLADVVLFGAFLVWAVFDFKAARARDRAAGVRHLATGAIPDVKAIVVGLVVWFVFVRYLHAWLIGVRPFG